MDFKNYVTSRGSIQAGELWGLRFGNEHKCPVCGKRFIVSNTDRWAYKRRVGTEPLPLCSWTCVNEFDRQKNAQKEIKKGALKIMKEMDLIIKQEKGKYLVYDKVTGILIAECDSLDSCYSTIANINLINL